MPLSVTNAIVFLLRLFRVVEVRQASKDRYEKKQRGVIEEAIRRKHTVKSLDSAFFNSAVSTSMATITKELDERFHEDLLHDP